MGSGPHILLHINILVNIHNAHNSCLLSNLIVGITVYPYPVTMTTLCT